MSGRVTIIDYGMGNLRSVQKAFEFLGAKAQVTHSASAIAKAERLVLPGVGAFGDAMQELRRRHLVDPIHAAIAKGTPFLGLCLGLQLLFESSEESPGVRGLGVLSGRVRRLPRKPKNLKVPHIGWNSLMQSKHAKPNWLLHGVPEGGFVYFVHSFYAEPKDKKVVAAETTYGTRFASVVTQDNVAATQFHPEKSQKVGLAILKNFIHYA
ncbi:MAG: imidazole glycerol phosphate synthase subunit HisH [Candidatus Omnitrophica bacterium]|nr:imidazole glycerol phosphate synthase subunit HisH [Candidatus Omnitrophota bacterium]